MAKARRASFKDSINNKQKVGQSNQTESQNKVTVGGSSLDYELTMIHETIGIDDDGERIEYKMRIPYTRNEYDDFVTSILDSRNPDIGRNFIGKVKDNMFNKGKEKVEELVMDSTILMGFSIKYKTFQDELVFRVVATDRLIDGAMTKLTNEINDALNKCQSEDELRVKWMMMKRVLSGRIALNKLHPEDYGHGFDVTNDRLGNNTVYGYRFGSMVLVSELDSKTMRTMVNISDSLFGGRLDWSISNFQPANIRAIGNMSFIIEDEREYKKNFYGVKYNIKLKEPTTRGGKSREFSSLGEIFQKRWLVNQLSELKVTLVDLDLELDNMKDDAGFKMRYPWETRGATVTVEHRGTKDRWVRDESSDDIGVFRSINYTGLFSENGTLLKEQMISVSKDYATKKLRIRDESRDRDGFIRIMTGNVSELFQILYMNDDIFKENVDNYFKEYKVSSVKMLVHVLEASKEIDLPLMLINKFKIPYMDVINEPNRS